MKQIFTALFLLVAIAGRAQTVDSNAIMDLTHKQSDLGVGDSLKLKAWPFYQRIEYIFVKDYSKVSAYRGINGDKQPYLLAVDFIKDVYSMETLKCCVIMFDNGTWIDGADIHPKGKAADPGLMAFNVSGSDIVTQIKQKSAELIDLCETLKGKDGRLASLAQWDKSKFKPSPLSKEWSKNP